MSLTLSPVTDARTWDDHVLRLPAPHLLQSWAWGEFKSRYEWKAERWGWSEGDRPAACGQLLRRSLPVRGFSSRLTVLYCPKGPAMDWSDRSLRETVLQDLERMARRWGSLFVKVDPDVPSGDGLPGEPEAHPDPLGSEVTAHLRSRGWVPAPSVQFRNTVLLDLRPSEAEILERMKPKTRYNLRLASRHGVTARPGGAADFDPLYRMYRETSIRDSFLLREREYYLDGWRTFLEAGLAQPILAELEGEPIAGIIVYRFGKTAYFLYGMSRDAHREAMPNYLLQWEAIRWARQHGCESYDLWGAPDRADSQDPLAGVYRFKSGLGGRAVQWIGAWDYAPEKTWYWLYSVAIPRVLSVLRSRRMARVRTLME